MMIVNANNRYHALTMLILYAAMGMVGVVSVILVINGRWENVFRQVMVILVHVLVLRVGRSPICIHRFYQGLLVFKVEALLNSLVMLHSLLL